ncbi:MAG: hypothetical protein WB565_18105 [Acidimicrobiales bacterium]
MTITQRSKKRLELLRKLRAHLDEGDPLEAVVGAAHTRGFAIDDLLESRAVNVGPVVASQTRRGQLSYGRTLAVGGTDPETLRWSALRSSARAAAEVLLARSKYTDRRPEIESPQRRAIGYVVSIDGDRSRRKPCTCRRRWPLPEGHRHPTGGFEY